MSARVHTDVFVDARVLNLRLYRQPVRTNCTCEHICPAVCIHVRIRVLVVVFVF